LTRQDKTNPAGLGETNNVFSLAFNFLLTDTSSINGNMADSFLDWCKARETAARSRFKRRGHKKKYAAEE
jgi:hypothetical protein